MFLTIFDLILILIAMIFAVTGFVTGLIQSIGKIIGLILGVWFAGIYFKDFGMWIDQYVPGDERVAKVVGFIVLFVMVSQVVGLIFYLLEKIFHIASIIPFMKTINRLAGAIFGLIEGVLVLSLVVYLIDRFFEDGWVYEAMQNSKIALWLLVIAKVFVPLLPEILKKVKENYIV